MPTSSDLVTDLPADFEVFGQAVDTALADLKGGTTGQVLAKNSGTDMDFVWTSPPTIPTVINPNLVINGNFTINQRGYVSAANLASGAYGFDRWKSNFTNTTLTFTSAPAGQSVTINTDGGLQQIVEQANVPAGTYVLSFTGTATGRIYNSGATPPSYAASPISFTADGLANVVVEFTATGATKTLGEVKLEQSTVATEFSYAGGTIQTELAACQRYYYRLTPASGSFGLGWTFSTTGGINVTNFPVTMRSAPSALEQSGTASNYNLTHTSSLTVCSAVPTFNGATVQSGMVTVTVASGFTAGQGTSLNFNSAGAFLGWSAEL